MYSKALCSFQYWSTAAAETSRFIDIRSLVPEWQGRELEKSSSVAKYDEVEFFPDFGGSAHPKV